MRGTERTARDIVLGDGAWGSPGKGNSQWRGLGVFGRAKQFLNNSHGCLIVWGQRETSSLNRRHSEGQGNEGAGILTAEEDGEEREGRHGRRADCESGHIHEIRASFFCGQTNQAPA